MPRPRFRLLLTGAAVAAAAATAAPALMHAAGHPAATAATAALLGSTASRGGGTANGSGSRQFTIADTPGKTAVLFPGGSVSRWVRITNPQNFPIKVQKLTAVVGQPVAVTGRPARGCPATAVTVGPLPAPVTLHAKSYADTPLTAAMKASAPNACKNVTFPLTYQGTAVKP